MTNKLKTLIVLAVFALLLLGAGTLYRSMLPEGGGAVAETDNTSAPDFSVTDAKGDTVSLSDYLGKPVVLNFWASWCGPCRSEMPHFDAAAKAYEGEVAFMMVNLTDGSRETIDGATDFLEEQGYTFPVFFDTLSKGAEAFAVRSIPATYFIDSSGMIQSSFIGSISEAGLDEGIQAILP